MEGKSKEAALEICIDDVDRDDGAETLITELDKLFLKDKLHLAYQAYDAFKKFKRPSETSIANYSAEFEKQYKATNYNMILLDGILAYKFLINASLSSQHQ